MKQLHLLTATRPCSLRHSGLDFSQLQVNMGRSAAGQAAAAQGAQQMTLSQPNAFLLTHLLLKRCSRCELRWLLCVQLLLAAMAAWQAACSSTAQSMARMHADVSQREANVLVQ